MNRRFLVKVIYASLLCVLGVSAAQSQTLVTITDTLKNADGTNAAGRVVISWDPFTAASGETVDGGTIPYTITNGVVNLSLAPNIGATPAGTSYRAQYYLTNRASYGETWVVPATGPVTIAAIRVTTVPSPTVTFNAALQLTNFDMSTQTFTRPVKLGTTLPATCTLGDLFVDTDLTPAGQQLYLCTATDTWTLVGDGGGAGSGITSLNGLTAATQTFAVPGTTGTVPTWSSATSIHTLNIPLAATASVTAGLLSKTDYDTFNAKESTLTFSSPLSRSVNTISCATCSVSGHTHTEANITDLAHRTAGVGIGLSVNDLSLDLAELVVNQTIFNSANASRTITFGLSGATDPVLTLADGVFNVSTGTLQQAGTAVSLSGHTHVEANITDLSHADASKLPLAGGTMTGELVLRAAGAAISGGGLVDCDNPTTSKLLWDITTARLSCGTDQGGGGGITNLEGQTGATQTFTDDTNVTIVSAADAHVITWAGTLAVARGGLGVGTITGLMQGNGTSAVTGITNSSTVGQVLRVTGASAYGFGALDLADGDAVTGLLPDGNVAASLMRDSELAAFTVTKTNMTYDAEGTGNVITLPFLINYKAAVCQNATATGGFSEPTSNAPAATCVTGTNTQFGTAAFDAATDESVQDRFTLPSDWTGNIDLALIWRAAATTGNAAWDLQTVCVDDAETGDPAFNVAQEVVDAAKGTANQFNDASISTVTVTGCTAGDTFFFKFFRDANDATNDTMTGDAELISLTFTIRRAM